MATRRQKYDKNVGYLFDDDNFSSYGVTPGEQAQNRNSPQSVYRDHQAEVDGLWAKRARKSVRREGGKTEKQKANQLSRIVSLAEEKAGINGNVNPSSADMKRVNRAFRASGFAGKAYRADRKAQGLSAG